MVFVGVCVFFFQAEDGIRDWSVTGVQTCALPISDHPGERRSDVGPPVDGPWAHCTRFVARPRTHRTDARPTPRDLAGGHDPLHALVRSEERRVGKKGRAPVWRDRYTTKDEDVFRA